MEQLCCKLFGIQRNVFFHLVKSFNEAIKKKTFLLVRVSREARKFYNAAVSELISLFVPSFIYY